jgi:tetratricopeptide (TPR) repeat protein/predicted Ser/Thr protein kinase
MAAMSSSTERTRLETPAKGLAVADTSPPPTSSKFPDFGTRYQVLGALGKGGMGEVYRAYDNELRGDVAVKIVRTDTDQGAGLARFRREIALARKVTSPNVLRVYDLAEHQGLRFLTMEYVDGTDLATLLQRQPRLPLERALSLFRQVCAGLIAAHAKGVVHRDLKPQNVLVDKDDHVHVADFGLARSIGESGMTASGAILGSPAYMSPEQVTGDATDERSDIYSLGVMLFQLVTGEVPFQADTVHAIMEMRLHKKPRPVRELVPDVPARVEAVVARCLEIDHGARYASVRDVIAELDGEPPRVSAAALAPAAPAEPPKRRRGLIVGGVAAAGAVALAVFALRPAHRGEPVSPAKPAAPVVTPIAPSAAAASPARPATDDQTQVLVLGFDNQANDPVFDGTLDTVLLYALRRSPKVDPFAGVDLRKLATELGPDVAVNEHLAERIAARDHTRIVSVRGTVTSKGAHIAISLSAVASTGASVFSKTLEATTFDDVVPVVAHLAAGLREALGEHLDDAERERTGLSRSLDADHDFSIGQAMKQAGNTDGAIEHFAQALAKDPTFVFAHAQLGIVQFNNLRIDTGQAELTLALKSVDQLGERDRLKLLGDYYLIVSQESARAVTAYEQLLSKWPKDQGGEINLANAYRDSGDTKHALEAAMRAAQDHPLSVVARANLSGFEIAANQFDRAIADIKQYVLDFPRTLKNEPMYLGLAYALTGHRDDALTAYAKLDSDPSVATAALADLAMGEGRLDDAAVRRRRPQADRPARGQTRDARRAAAAARRQGRRPRRGGRRDERVRTPAAGCARAAIRGRRTRRARHRGAARQRRRAEPSLDRQADRSRGAAHPRQARPSGDRLREGARARRLAVSTLPAGPRRTRRQAIHRRVQRAADLHRAPRRGFVQHRRAADVPLRGAVHLLPGPGASRAR